MNSSDKGGVVVAIGLVLILLLSAGGVAVYFIISRQQMVVMQADRAQLAEKQARMEAERARVQVEAAARARRASYDKESSTGANKSVRAAVESILRAQEAAWNEGNVAAFMEHYWKSHELTFSSGGKTTRGWTETMNRYRERYPTPDKMGRLKLSDLEVTPLGDSAALVLGEWGLERESDPLSGNFSLVVRKLDDRWLIVHDHTSRTLE